MLRALIAWLKPTGKSGEESDDSAEEDESESTFLRSRLDASVLSSHGVRTANKPVQELESEAGELAEQFPDQHQQFEDPKQ